MHLFSPVMKTSNQLKIKTGTACHTEAIPVFCSSKFRKRPTGIEPASEAWEAPVLPLYYDREDIHQFTPEADRIQAS